MINLNHDIMVGGGLHTLPDVDNTKKYWPLTLRDDVFVAIALGAVSPEIIQKLTPPVITNTREWLLYMVGTDPDALKGYYDRNGDGLVGDPEITIPSEPPDVNHDPPINNH